MIGRVHHIRLGGVQRDYPLPEYALPIVDGVPDTA
jgi:hypothetical protein